MPQFSEPKETSISLSLDICLYKLTEPETIVSLPSTYLNNTKESSATSSLEKDQITSSFMAELSDNVPNPNPNPNPNPDKIN